MSPPPPFDREQYRPPIRPRAPCPDRRSGRRPGGRRHPGPSAAHLGKRTFHRPGVIVDGRAGQRFRAGTGPACGVCGHPLGEPGVRALSRVDVMTPWLIEHLSWVAESHQHGEFDAVTDVVETSAEYTPQSLEAFIRQNQTVFGAHRRLSNMASEAVARPPGAFDFDDDASAIRCWQVAQLPPLNRP